MSDYNGGREMNYEFTIKPGQMGAIGDLFGLPIYAYDREEPVRRVLVFEQGNTRVTLPDVVLRHTSGDVVLDYIREKANELRRRLGLTEVDYAAEDHLKDQVWRFIAEARLGMRLQRVPPIVTTP